MSRVPRIRFKGFEEDWEQRKAKELCNIGTGKSNTQDQAEDGMYTFYIRSDVPVKSNKYIYDCEAVITIGDGNIGRVFHYVNGKFDLHQRCYRMTDFQNVLGKYFYYFFSTRFYDRAMKMTAKATVDSVRIEMISEMDILMPTEIDEQKNIADFFTQLDHLITLHQRKLEKLKIIKKSMLENLFTQNGEKTPKIRFSGFTEDWEQRKLGEIVNVCNGRDYKHLLEGDIPVYGTGGYMISVNKALSYDRDAIGIGRKGTIDKPYILNAPFWTVDTLFYVIPRDKIALIFAFGIFQNIEWEKKDESTGVPSLSKAAINEIDVLIPKYEEQQVLGIFFNGLDHLITLHQSKLEKLQKIKKSMLESMFV
nr:restriction endonuclease subunit S [uncultured Lachnoanaerobaculum sp.]